MDLTFTAQPGHAYRTYMNLPMMINLHSSWSYNSFAINNAADIAGGPSRATIYREAATTFVATNQFSGIFTSVRETGLSGTIKRGCRYMGGSTNNIRLAGTNSIHAAELYVIDEGAP